MSLACAPSVVPPLPTETDGTIANDGFLPDVDLTQVRASMRETGITPARLRLAAIGAMLAVSRDLAGWKRDQLALGRATLAAVPADLIGGRSVLVLAYERAIAAFTRAELIERHPDSDQTAQGRGRDGAAGTAVDDLRRDGAHAVRDILGVGRTAVELI